MSISGLWLSCGKSKKKKKLNVVEKVYGKLKIINGYLEIYVKFVLKNISEMIKIRIFKNLMLYIVYLVPKVIISSINL